jgi:uncharacterized protein YbjT (DUF2867 family)
MSMSMSIVVTGATGHLGRLIIERLIARGTAPADIVAAGRNTERLAAIARLGASTAVIDFANPASLDSAFAGADTLMLVSGSEVGQRTKQHTNAISAAARSGITRIVYTSAPHADTSALILAPEHKATEQALRDSGIPFTILRNNWYTENYLSSMTQASGSGTYADSTRGGLVASASRIDFADAAAVVLTTAATRTRHTNSAETTRGTARSSQPRWRRCSGRRSLTRRSPRSSTRLPSPRPAWTRARSVSWWRWTATSMTAFSVRRRVTWPG